MTTSTGAVAERYAYTAYGQPTILNASGSVLTSSAVGNRYTYTGREWDATLGLHHFRARWMSPLAGRFLGRDPIGFEGATANIYQFMNSRIFKMVDPTGHKSYTCTCSCMSVAPYMSITPRPTTKESEVIADTEEEARTKCTDSCDKVSLSPWGVGAICKGYVTELSIFLCMRDFADDVKCRLPARACGGAHTYIQFGGVNPDGTPCENTSGCGFSGGILIPGVTLPEEEKNFNPLRCNLLIIPPGKTRKEMEDCLRNYPIMKEYNPLGYNCAAWARDATKHCGLTVGTEANARK